MPFAPSIYSTAMSRRAIARVRGDAVISFGHPCHLGRPILILPTDGGRLRPSLSVRVGGQRSWRARRQNRPLERLPAWFWPQLLHFLLRLFGEIANSHYFPGLVRILSGVITYYKGAGQNRLGGKKTDLYPRGVNRDGYHSYNLLLLIALPQTPAQRITIAVTVLFHTKVPSFSLSDCVLRCLPIALVHPPYYSGHEVRHDQSG